MNKFAIALSTIAAALTLAGGASSLLAQSANTTGQVGLTCTPDQLKTSALNIAKQNIQTFDTLDFDVFTNQKWDRLKESHAKNIVVHMPDGRTTTGIETHTENLKMLFSYAPDTRILEHPIRIGCGDLTAVTGVMEGTFTKPFYISKDQFIPPTNKAFKLSMATIGRWENGVMVEEWLFWDNQLFMQQLGLGK